jgi:hypothetical protein
VECVEVCAASGSVALRDAHGYTVEAVEVLRHLDGIGGHGEH